MSDKNRRSLTAVTSIRSLHGMRRDDVLDIYRRSRSFIREFELPSEMIDPSLQPILDRLRQYLSDPVVQEQSDALLDVLDALRSMNDMLPWLEDPILSWRDYCAVLDAHRQIRQAEWKQKCDEDWLAHVHAGFYYDPALGSRKDDPERTEISESCPDCGSDDITPIEYGFPDREMVEEALRGEIILGGCCLGGPSRHCNNCLNVWVPRSVSASKPVGTPEWIQAQIEHSRSEYIELCTLANRPVQPDDARVACAWERIDGSVEFYVIFPNDRCRLARSVALVPLGGAPQYHLQQDPRFLDWADACKQAAVAAIRYERTHQPKRHNLFNEWDVKERWLKCQCSRASSEDE